MMLRRLQWTTECSGFENFTPRMKELSSVQVKPEDVQVIVQELDITKQQADMLLRENQGDLVKALRAAV